MLILVTLTDTALEDLTILVYNNRSKSLNDIFCYQIFNVIE
jgi:hypothetical protein